MIKKSFMFSFILLSATVLFLHCSSNSAPSLSDSQSDALVSAIGSSIGLVVEDSLSALSAANLITKDISKSTDCDGGGTITATGTQAGVEEVTIDGASTIQVKFTDCEISVSGSDTITANGTLDVGGSIDLEGSESGITGTLSSYYTGSLALTGDNLEPGDCDVDINVTATASGDTVDFTSTGSLCGDDVDFSATEPVN